MIKYKTGMELSPFFSASKYRWLIENSEAVRDCRIRGNLAFGTVDSWILFKLTKCKEYKTDCTNASRTQLLNIKSLNWDNELCEIFDIKTSELPAVCDCDSFFGMTNFEGIFPKSIPIYSMIGDSQAALFAHSGSEEAAVKATYGTGTSVMMNIGDIPIIADKGIVTSVGIRFGGKTKYVFEGNINYSGAVIAWLKDDLKLINSANETEELAYAANPDDTIYLIPAFSGLGAPYWRSDIKAAITGMSRTTGRNEIVKAALESIAYQITDVLNIMKRSYGGNISELYTDGGASRNLYLMEFQSSVAEVCVTPSSIEECSAAGAAYIAGLKCGLYNYAQLFKKSNRYSFMPSDDKLRYQSKYSGWKKAVSVLLQ